MSNCLVSCFLANNASQPVCCADFASNAQELEQPSYRLCCIAMVNLCMFTLLPSATLIVITCTVCHLLRRFCASLHNLLQAVTWAQDAGPVFIDNHYCLKFLKERVVLDINLQQSKYVELAGHRMIWCNLPKGGGFGSKDCTAIDYRLILPSDGGPPILFLFQMKCETGTISEEVSLRAKAV